MSINSHLGTAIFQYLPLPSSSSRSHSSPAFSYWAVSRARFRSSSSASPSASSSSLLLPSPGSMTDTRDSSSLRRLLRLQISRLLSSWHCLASSLSTCRNRSLAWTTSR